MKNIDYVYAVVCYHDNNNNIRLKAAINVSTIHKNLRDAEIQCAENNKWRHNAKPNPEFKRTHSLPYNNYIKINKKQPACWYYVKTMRLD